MSKAETHNTALNEIRVEMLSRKDLQAEIHNEKWGRSTSGYAGALKSMIVGLAMYADAHAYQYEEGIGEDGVLGEAWSDAVYAVLELLNGELGGLEGGTLDKMLLGMLRREGFEK